MPKQAPIRHFLSSRQLAQLWLSSDDPDRARVWQALYLLTEGASVGQVAATVRAHRNSVRNWRDAYNQQGASFRPPVSSRLNWRKLD